MEWKLKPARDLGLPFAARLRSPLRERSLGGLAMGTAWQAVVRTYLRVVHDLSVTGL
jgi:hypothetical protein